MRSRFALVAIVLGTLAQPALAKQKGADKKAPAAPAQKAPDKGEPTQQPAPAQPAPAPASDSADCSYVEIAATNAKDAGSIDAALKPLEKKLKKPPFTAWNTFKQLSSGAAALGKNKPHTLKLQQGAASIMLRDRAPKRVELTVTLDNAAGKRVLDAKPAFKAGDWIILVVTNAKDDGHLLGLTCK